MFGRLFRRGTKISPKRPGVARLGLEALEGRDVPSALTVQVTYNQGASVTLSGALSDPSGNTADQTVTLVGPISGNAGGHVCQATTDANGDYAITVQMTGSGPINVRASAPTAGLASAYLEDPEDPSYSGPPVLSLQLSYGAGSAVTISGVLSDPAGSTAGQTITLDGPIVGSGGGDVAQATTNASGNYSVTLQAAGSGSLTAQATAPTPVVAAATLNVPGNASATLTMQVAYDGGAEVTIWGALSSPTGDTAKQTVTLTGPFVGNVGPNTVQTTTDASGNYSVTVQATGQGAVVAQASVPAAVAASVTLVDPGVAPVITRFYASAEDTANYWLLQGTVQYAASYSGLVVQFGGQPVDIAGLTEAVGSDGTFQLAVELNGQASDNGLVTAVAVDSWGVQSQTAFDLICQG
jgi:ribose 5-phosphate isomerase RpiB